MDTRFANTSRAGRASAPRSIAMKNTPQSRPGPKLGSQNAKKDNPATSHIHIRCTPAEKAAVVRAANGQKLSEYIRKKIGL